MSKLKLKKRFLEKFLKSFGFGLVTGMPATIPGSLREATRQKKQLNFGFLLKGEGRSNPNPKLSRNFSRNLISA